MDPLILVILSVFGYLVVGALTARAMWRINHETVDGTRDTVAVTLGWPIVLASLAATCTADGLHQLVTRPTRPERLQQQYAILQRRISQLEQDLEIDERDETESSENGGPGNAD